jgi:Electron transfer DM13
MFREQCSAYCLYAVVACFGCCSPRILLGHNAFDKRSFKTISGEAGLDFFLNSSRPSCVSRFMNKFLLGLVLFTACSTSAPIAPPTTETILQVGSFYPVVHAGSGTVKIVQKSDGKRFLRLENFSTDNGPVIYVWLSTAIEPKSSAAVSINVGDYEQIGDPIPAGTNYPIVSQEFEIPEAVNLSSFKSVVIWCVKFKVNFASAALQIP